MNGPTPNPIIKFQSELIHGGVESVGYGKTFDVPFFSNILGNLWTGAMPRFEMPSYFTSVLNLYPWETYKHHSIQGENYRVLELHDGDDIDTEVIYDGAEWINDKLSSGPTLVHCQAGINRSSLVASVALLLQGFPREEIIPLIREKRSDIALSNRAFVSWFLHQPEPEIVPDKWREK